MPKQMMILNASENMVAVLSNELPGACPIEEAYQYQEALEGGAYSDSLALTVPSTHPDAAHLVMGAYLLFQDADGNWQEYRIIQAQRIDSGSANLLAVTAEHAAYELLGDFIDDIRPSLTAGLAVSQALTGTRWELGTADDLGTSSTAIYKTSVLAGLVQIATAWGGELRFRLTVTGGVINHRYVDILTRRGSETGKRFELQKDLIEIKQTVDTRFLVSALIGRGKGLEIETDTGSTYGRRLEFTDEVWTTPLAKPAGQNWIGDDTVAAAYGPGGRHIKDVATFDDCTDAAELLQLTYNELQIRKLPRVTYEMTVIMLEAMTGYAHEAVRLGDTVYVINTSVTPAITGQARVTRLDRNLIDPREGTVVLGNYIPTLASAITSMSEMQASMRDRAGVWDRSTAITPLSGAGGALEYQIDLLKTQLAATASGMSTDANGNMIFENADKTAALKLGAGILAIANSKTGGEYNWRTFGTGDGFTADEIVSGMIAAARISIGASSTFAAGYDPSTKETPSGAQAKADAAQSAAQSYVDGIASSLQDQIDGSITTWFYAYIPTGSNLPASGWTTTDLKNQHLGDLFYDTTTGYSYRWQLVTGTYSWARITDTDVTKALADAAKAQDTADSKRRVFTTTPTTPYEVGDLWAGGATGDLKRCKTERLTGDYNAADWELASKYIDAKYVQSRGENLVTNGTALLGDNTNFSVFTFDGADNYSCNGSFKHVSTQVAKTIDEKIPVNPDLSYKMSYYIKANPYVSGSLLYGFVNCYDADGLAIDPGHVMYFANTLTTLAQELKNGDTVVYLTSAANWKNAAGSNTFYRRFIFWNYVNSFGYAFPELTYSRNVSAYDTWADGAVDFVNNTITLRSAWSGGTYPAGTKVSNGNSAGSYKYIAGAANNLSGTWTNYSGLISGVDNTGLDVLNKFRPGTASIKIGWLLNYGTPGSTVFISNVSFGIDVETVAGAAAKVAVAQAAADAAQSTANTASTNATNALNQLTDITSDSKITAVEKQLLKKEWDAIAAEKSVIDAQADTFGITTEKATYGTKYSALNTYVNTTYPLFTDMTTTVTIDAGTTLRTKFKEYYDARTALLNAIATKAKTLADTAQSAANAAQAAADAAQADASQAISAAAGAQATADGKVTTFVQAAAPTAEGVGDLWMDSDDGNKLYRWSGSAWVAVQDTAIGQAISAAAAAQSTANGKIVSFYQTTAPTASATGDFWVDTDDGNKLYRWSGSAWVAVQFGTAALMDASISLAKLGTTIIEGGYIKTSLLTATNIVTGKMLSTDGKTYFDINNSEIKETATVGGQAIVITINPTVGLQITRNGTIVGGISSDGYLTSNFVSQAGASPTSRISIGSETIGAYSGYGLTLSNLISSTWTKVASLASFSYGLSWITQLTAKNATGYLRFLDGESANLYSSNSGGTESTTLISAYNGLSYYYGGTELLTLNSSGALSILGDFDSPNTIVGRGYSNDINADTIVTPGIYKMTGSNYSTLNYPTQYGILVVSCTNTYVSQTWHAHTNAFYTRFSANTGSSWSTWALK